MHPLLLAVILSVSATTVRSCNYTEWSSWSEDCPPANTCRGGVQTRNRNADEGCTDVVQMRQCTEECKHVAVAYGLLPSGKVYKSAQAEANPPVDVEAFRYTYGSLTRCSQGCSDFKGLNTDHDTVCLMCTNSDSCRRTGALETNLACKLDLVRYRRVGLHAVKLDGPDCSCSFTPEMPLMKGVCSVPSYYINFTVL